MDANNRESAADVSNASASWEQSGGMRPTISDKAAYVKDALNEFGQRSADKLDESREPAARAMENASTSLHSGVDRVSGLGHSAANRLQASAEYIRETDLETVVDDVQNLFKRYPVQMLAGAAILGFLVVRGFRRSA